MKKLSLLLCCYLCLQAIEVKPQKLTIQEVDKKSQTLVLKPSKVPFYVGESGIVIHSVGSAVISNLITLTSVADTEIHANYRHFDLLEQRYLPTPIIEPRAGDSVIMRSFYSRAFIVAPNQKLYESIKTLFPQINFVSSDLMIADVADEGIVHPSPKAFAKMCSIYSVGLLMLYAHNKLNILDCQSFQVLQSQELVNPSPKEQMYPFFARVKAKSFWDFLIKPKDYYKTYDTLIK